MKISDISLASPDWAVMHRFGSVGRLVIRNEIGLIGTEAESVLRDIAGCKEVFVNITDCLGGDLLTALDLWAPLAIIHTEVTISGKCHSAAVAVAMAGCKIRMRHDAQLLIHAPQTAVYGPVPKLEKGIKSLRQAHIKLLDILSARTGQPIEIVDDWLRTDTFFNAQQALDVGLIDEIIPPPPVVTPATPSSEPPAPSMLPTEDESLFFDFLHAMGEKITVRSKNDFCRALSAWVTANVEEETNSSPCDGGCPDPAG